MRPSHTSLSLSFSLSLSMPTQPPLEFTPQDIDKLYECCVCFDEMTVTFALQCNHKLCGTCYCRGTMAGAKKDHAFTEVVDLAQNHRKDKCNACGEEMDLLATKDHQYLCSTVVARYLERFPRL